MFDEFITISRVRHGIRFVAYAFIECPADKNMLEIGRGVGVRIVRRAYCDLIN